MNDDTLIADLVRAGLSADLVGRVFNEIMRQQTTTLEQQRQQTTSDNIVDNVVATSTTTAERKREYNRNRQRLVRSGEWDNIQTTNDNITKPTIYIEDTNTNNKKERKCGSLCPDNFRPTQSHYQAGTLLGLSAAAVDGLCDEMRAWSHTNANRAVARKADWGLALHGWIKRQYGNGAVPNKATTPVSDEEYARLKAKYDAKVARTA